MRTPGKVKIDAEGVVFAMDEGVNICSMYPFNRDDNSQFLLKAWNCHDDLVGALEAIISTESSTESLNNPEMALLTISNIALKALALVEQAAWNEKA